MLKRLLKYDLRAMLKYWWIAAISSFVMSIIAGGCVNMLISEYEEPVALTILSVLFIIVDIIGLSAFTLISAILIYVRFYKNFFTDEGYLTFTLPVKRTALLNSKLISGTFVMLLTTVVAIINVCITVAIGFWQELFVPEALEGMAYAIEEAQKALGVYLIIYAVEIIALFVTALLCSVLFISICITFASIITKKARVITAIGIYYAVNAMVNSITQLVYMIGLDYVVMRLPENNINGPVAVIGFGVILLFALIASLLYTLEYWMLDRKLNLA